MIIIDTCFLGTEALPAHLEFFTNMEPSSVNGDSSAPVSPSRSTSSSRPTTPSSTHSRNGGNAKNRRYFSQENKKLL